MMKPVERTLSESAICSVTFLVSLFISAAVAAEFSSAAYKNWIVEGVTIEVNRGTAYSLELFGRGSERRHQREKFMCMMIRPYVCV